MTSSPTNKPSGERPLPDEAVAFLNELCEEPPPSLREIAEQALIPEQRTPLGLKPSCLLTIVVPTRNEQRNIAPLVARLETALAHHAARVLFVDDSDDETPLEVVRVAALAKIPVDVLHREPAERAGGLGTAVLEGLRVAGSPFAVVMDGDLQHPPEVVPQLLATALDRHAEVVVASRRIAGGSSQGLSNVGRELVSSSSTALSKLAFPRNLRGISDPMSGFFLLRLDAFDLDAMRPRGFKILLELLAREGLATKAEVPFTFAEREAGASKASFSEGLTFLRQLVKLRVGSTLATALRSGVLQRGVGFAAIGLTGLVVNMAVLWLLADRSTLGMHYLVAAVISTQLSSSWNFVWVDSMVYPGVKRLTKTARYLGFLMMSNTVLVLRIPLLAVLVSLLGIHYLQANLLTLLLGYLVRFRSQERLTLMEDS